jgi:urease accessory protein
VVDAGRSATAQLLGRVRVDGGIRASFVADETRSRVANIAERDGYRMRTPRGATGLEGVIINTGGGVAGGDRVSVALSAGPEADVLVTTQSAERVYRAIEGSRTTVDIALCADRGARLVWMPQETILFDGARLARRLSADIAPDARLLVIESIVFGRMAHGEKLSHGQLDDRWRLRRDGRLALAESLRIEGAIADQLSRPGVADGARTAGTAVYMAADAEDRLPTVRSLIATAGCRLAASTWNGMLVVRGLATAAAPLRAALAALVPLLAGRPVPRVWQM